MNLTCENLKTILIFFFSRLLIIIFASGTIIYSAEAAGQEQFNLVKIHVAEVENIEEMEADAAAMKRSNKLKTFGFRRVFSLSPGFRWAIVTDNDIEFLEERGYDVEFVMKGAETKLHKRVVWGEEMVLPEGYLPYAEICNKLKELNRKNPEITRLEIIGKTQQYGRDIIAFKISDNAHVSEEEPRIMFSGAIHADEIMGTAVCLALVDKLIEGYGRDKKITGFVNSNEIWFVPVINVDGYEIATKTDPHWRKNARDNDGDGQFSPGDGVDLNRNFDFNWQTSGSSKPSSTSYRGPFPFSESETRAMDRFVRKQKFLFSITYHSAWAVVFYPWRSGTSWADDSSAPGTPGEIIYASEHGLISEIAETMAGKISCLNRDFTYKARPNTQWDSYTNNYYYGELGTIDFMVELGKYDDVYPKPMLDKMINNNLPAAFYLLERAAGPGLSGKITEKATGNPISAEIRVLEFSDMSLAPRTSDANTGRYYRALKPGEYDVLVAAEGMKSKIFRNIKINEEGWTILDVSLEQW